MDFSRDVNLLVKRFVLAQPRIIPFTNSTHAIHEWRSLAYIRDWYPSHSRIAYASQEQALSYAIHEWEVIRDWTRTDCIGVYGK
jgi:hypothetical protein